jgi:hypothetical protein
LWYVHSPLLQSMNGNTISQKVHDVDIFRDR